MSRNDQNYWDQVARDQLQGLPEEYRKDWESFADLTRHNG